MFKEKPTGSVNFFNIKDFLVNRFFFCANPCEPGLDIVKMTKLTTLYTHVNLLFTNFFLM